MFFTQTELVSGYRVGEENGAVRLNRRPEAMV
jgi:hypothetical protein